MWSFWKLFHSPGFTGSTASDLLQDLILLTQTCAHTHTYHCHHNHHRMGPRLQWPTCGGYYWTRLLLINSMPISIVSVCMYALICVQRDEIDWGHISLVACACTVVNLSVNLALSPCCPVKLAVANQQNCKKKNIYTTHSVFIMRFPLKYNKLTQWWLSKHPLLIWISAMLWALLYSATCASICTHVQASHTVWDEKSKLQL